MQERDCSVLKPLEDVVRLTEPPDLVPYKLLSATEALHPLEAS